MNDFAKEYILDCLPHLLDKIDIILMSAITLMGFMIASLTILKIVIPKHFNEISTLKDDIYKVFEYAIMLLILSALFSIIAFFFNGFKPMEYVALIAFMLFISSLYYIYKSVNIIFMLEDNN